MIRTTHTYATLELPYAAYWAVRKAIIDAGQEERFNENGEIDMQGIAVVSAAAAPAPGSDHA